MSKMQKMDTEKFVGKSIVNLFTDVNKKNFLMNLRLIAQLIKLIML